MDVSNDVVLVDLWFGELVFAGAGLTHLMWLKPVRQLFHTYEPSAGRIH